MAYGKDLPDQYRKTYGFRVDITGGPAPSGNEGSWRSIEGGGVIFDECAGVTVGTDQFKNHSAGIARWQPLRLVGSVTKDRKDMLDWFKKMVDKGGEGECYRDVSVTLIDRDGSDMYTINYLECFLTSYSLCPLDGDAEDQEAYETIEIQVGYSDNYLTTK